MKILCIVALVFAIPPFIFGFFMPAWYLGNQQNAIENVDLTGQKVENPDVKEVSAKADL